MASFNLRVSTSSDYLERFIRSKNSISIEHRRISSMLPWLFGYYIAKVGAALHDLVFKLFEKC